MNCVNCGTMLSKVLANAEDIKIKYADSPAEESVVYFCNRCRACFNISSEGVLNELSFKIRKISVNETITIKGLKFIFPIINAGLGSRDFYLVVTNEVLSNGTLDEIGLTFTQADFFNFLKSFTINYIISTDFEDEIATPSQEPILSLSKAIYVTRLPRDLSTYNGIINHLFYNTKIIKK